VSGRSLGWFSCIYNNLAGIAVKSRYRKPRHFRS